MLRVQRDPVHDALKWLKENNLKYYGDIIIDEGRLKALPTDGVPDAIRAGVQYETNELMANDEYRGYTPESYYTNNFGVEELNNDASSLFTTRIAVSHSNDDDLEADKGGPNVVPLQYLGVMDNDLTRVSPDTVVDWGLQNMHKYTQPSHHEFSYAVRHGVPVNMHQHKRWWIQMDPEKGLMSGPIWTHKPPKGQPADPARDNFWEAALTPLCPYGVGGIESDRPVPLLFNDQAIWSLEYHDRRF
ncbi:hypothetical protein FRC12_014015 [Ceratobasidium sp. 428]|nr:hypothetical protein FRC12_014015 [Ceratobasidium sp. 428]